jgi:hypothetical protein
MTGNQERRTRRSLPSKMPHCREVGRIVLAIAVEHCNPGPSRGVNPGADRGTLAIVSGVAEQSHLRGCACEPRDLGASRIIAAVIDIHNLILDQTVERSTDLGDERRDIVSLVPYWDDDGEIH